MRIHPAHKRDDPGEVPPTPQQTLYGNQTLVAELASCSRIVIEGEALEAATRFSESRACENRSTMGWNQLGWKLVCWTRQ
jgi:hypothetical protein